MFRNRIKSFLWFRREEKGCIHTHVPDDAKIVVDDIWYVFSYDANEWVEVGPFVQK